MAVLKTDSSRNALIVSPFATSPSDAGHRRRVWQMTNLLAEAGYTITFLLFAFEDGWAWRHDETAATAMREEWDETIIVHAGQHVGRAPVDGTHHALDEWWDAALESALANIASRRCFDVVVVHNVWLSKAFDFVHSASVKVLETHDLFWKREAAFALIGQPASFFAIDRDSELFGLSRADILVTIQERDARELLALSGRRVVNVPFYDPALESDLPAATLRNSGKTSFGVLASANPFNTHGVNALIEAVEAEVARTFAPIEIVVGGSVGGHIRCRLPVKRLGRVPNEADFYAGVDYALAPVFAGTGFKIKTGDALALGGPMLAATHAAEGTTMDRSLVFDTAQEMAARMAEIAIRRPDPRAAQASVVRARDALRSASQAGARHFLRAIARHKTVVVVDLHDTDIEHSALKLQGWTGIARELAVTRTIFILPSKIRSLIGKLLPPGVQAMTLAHYDVHADQWPHHVMIDATDHGALRDCAIRDQRWCFDGSGGLLSDLPLLHPNVAWEPAAKSLREAWRGTPTALGNEWAPGLLMLRPNVANSRGFVDCGDIAMFSAALMRLVCEPAAFTVLMSGAASPQIRKAAVEACAIFNIRYRGLVDDCALAPEPLPPSVGRDIVRRFRIGATSLVQSKEHFV